MSQEAFKLFLIETRLVCQNSIADDFEQFSFIKRSWQNCQTLPDPLNIFLFLKQAKVHNEMDINDLVAGEFFSMRNEAENVSGWFNLLSEEFRVCNQSLSQPLKVHENLFEKLSKKNYWFSLRGGKWIKKIFKFELQNLVLIDFNKSFCRLAFNAYWIKNFFLGNYRQGFS